MQSLLCKVEHDGRGHDLLIKLVSSKVSKNIKINTIGNNYSIKECVHVRPLKHKAIINFTKNKTKTIVLIWPGINHVSPASSPGLIFASRRVMNVPAKPICPMNFQLFSHSKHKLLQIERKLN